jgi:galactokinase
MGGVADYSGALLLQMPIGRRVEVEVRLRPDSDCNLVSAQVKGEVVVARREHFFDAKGRLLSPAAFRAGMLALAGDAWPLYVLGGLYELLKMEKASYHGLDIAVRSHIPMGKGLSSSAALEVATLRALCAALRVDMAPMDMALAAQRVENQLVGAPCGLMDQLSVTFGQPGILLSMCCQSPPRVFAPLPIPAGIRFVGVDSGVRHAVSGDPYGEARAAAFMGYTVIASYEGASLAELRAARHSGEWNDLPFGGFLANIDPATFESRHASLLPDEMTGKDFLRRFGVSIDRAAEIRPEKRYRILACARHPIEENERIRLFHDALKGWGERLDSAAAAARRLGAYMLESHHGYTAIGLGSGRTDELVDRLLAAGRAQTILGARVSGGGSGGTVVAMCWGEDGEAALREAARSFGRDHGFQPECF